MPWCEECAKYWTPNAMNADGTCPKCGRPVEAPEPHESIDDESAPWHFKLLVACVVAYLAWRFIQIFT